MTLTTTSATGSAATTFVYEAVDQQGNRTKGTVAAPNESAAALALREQGVVALSMTTAGRGLRSEITMPGLGNRVRLKDLAVFARQFATMTASGLSLLRSLAILEERTDRATLHKAIRDVRHDIEDGLGLSAAMAKQGNVFPPLMVAMIRAGETGGFLDTALDRVAVTFEKDANLRAKIKSALTYPVIVIAFSLVLITGVLIFVVPIFERLFAQLGGTLPLPTRVMVATSHRMWWLAPLVATLTIVGTTQLRRKLRADYTWRLALDRLKLRVPVFGKLFTKIAISRFARNLGTLLSAGVPVLQALDVVGGTAGNAVIAEAMTDVQAAVRDGQPMSAPLTAHPVFPLMVTQMMQVGEETGQISAMLDKIADYYDHEVETATESLAAALEPVMVIAMGAIIGALVVCLYLPMFTIYQHIQGAS